MAKHNTHRAAGRAATPVSNARVAARGVGGAAILGTVLVGSAFVGGSAQAAPAAPAPAAPVTAPVVAPAAPEAAAPSVVLNTTEKLRWGSRGGNVADLQNGLNQNGANLAEDGKFGPRTHAAVKDFQRSNGLQVDGVVGPETRGALNGGAAVPSGGTSAPVSSNNVSSSSIVDRARSVVGHGYSHGGSSPSSGFDCSGLITYAYQGSGLNLNGRTSSQITNGGRTISQSQAQPGDIVSWPGHVGIYAGNGKVIDASGSKYRVTERSIWGNPTFVSYR